MRGSRIPVKLHFAKFKHELKRNNTSSNTPFLLTQIIFTQRQVESNLFKVQKRFYSSTQANILRTDNTKCNSLIIVINFILPIITQQK